MKKIIFLSIISLGFTISGFSMNYEKPKENSRTHKMQPNKNANKVKPAWDCWHIAIACINGFFVPMISALHLPMPKQ